MTGTTASRRPQTGRLIVWTVLAALILLPVIATRFTPEVTWSASDFLFWAALLGMAGGGYELLARTAPNRTYRAAAGIALAAAFLLIWINLAVGIIGSEQDDANMMYAGVLAVAVGGACLAHLRNAGMARAMVATAGAQLLVAVIAVAFGLGSDGPVWPRDVLGVTAMLTGLWLASAWLFRRA